MKVDISSKGGQARLILNGRFDFGCRQAFRQACDQAMADGQAQELVVDLAAVDYLDSSALGMLLLLRDRAIAANRSVSLANGRGMVRDVLKVASFDRFFTLH